MFLFTKIISYISSIFKSKKFSEIDKDYKQNSLSSEEDYIGSLSFRLTKDYEIDIFCGLPSILQKNEEEKLELAEKFSEFLLQINEGYLQQDIMTLIKEHAIKAKDDNYFVFLENIMVYWAMLHVESHNSLKRKTQKDQPVIRPLSVFNKADN